MRHAHALAILVLAALVAAAGVYSPSLAQTAIHARARPQTPPAVVVATGAAPTRAPAEPLARLTLQGLPRRFDAGPACRARCLDTRVACEAVEDACAPEWSACLRRCIAA